MKKIFFTFALFALCSCSSNNEYKAKAEAYDKLLAEMRADRLEREREQMITLTPERLSVDVHIKKGESLYDVTVFTDGSPVDFIFSDAEEEIARIFSVYLPKGEELKKWGPSEIKTNKRTIKVNLIYE